MLNRRRIFHVLFFSAFTLFCVDASAKEYWNGSECVACPDGAFTSFDPLKNSSPTRDSSGGGGSRPLPSAGPTDFTLNGSARLPDEFVLVPQESSVMYFVVGPVKHVDAKQHLVVVENRSTRKRQNIFVFDPIIHSLHDRNVVEVWLKPGSSRAERIHRLS